MDRELEGRVAVVSGAGSASGIGAATVRLLCAAGARVVMTDLAQSDIRETAASLSAEGLDVTAAIVDISDEQEVRKFFDWVHTTFGRLDVIDNNAANQANPTDTTVTELDVGLWDRIITTNARGTMLMCKHALPLMIQGGGGSIINISSGTSLAGDFYATAYACSKGAINTLTKYVATQYGHQGIRCNAVAPGLVMTAALDRSLPPPVREIFRGHSLTGELGQPRDIAEAVLFLASDRSRFITGQVISVDGGIYAHIPTVPEVRNLQSQT